MCGLLWSLQKQFLEWFVLSVQVPESGKRYFVIADGGRGGGSAGDGGMPSDACGPEFIFEEGIKAYYSIYLPNGGHTTQELKVNTYAVGESVT